MSDKERWSAERAQAQVQQVIKDLSDQTLRDFAGDKVFARGKAYAASGAVQDLQDLPPTPDHLMGGAVHGARDRTLHHRNLVVA